MNTFVHKVIFNKLTKFLEEEELFLTGNLRLDDIAERLKTNKVYVSNIVNERFKMNFPTLLNHYRVKKAVEHLKRDDAQIKTAWSKAGFCSQSAFNKAFRKEMGMTPTEWLSENKRSLFIKQDSGNAQ